MLNTAFTSVDNYFSRLSVTGSVPNCDYSKAMFMVCIEDFLYYYYLDYVNGEVLSKIRKAIVSILETSCLVPYTNTINMSYINNGGPDVFDIDYAPNILLSELLRRIEDIENTEVVVG